MKNATTQQIENLVSFFESSAYVNDAKIVELATSLYQKGDILEENEASIFNDICSLLDNYYYVECENQGSFHRHIWHLEE